MSRTIACQMCIVVLYTGEKEKAIRETDANSDHILGKHLMKIRFNFDHDCLDKETTDEKT